MKISVSNEAFIAVHGHAIGNPDWRATHKQEADGSWMMEVSEDTYNGILAQMVDGETLSDALVRIASTAGRKLM